MEFNERSEFELGIEDLAVSVVCQPMPTYEYRGPRLIEGLSADACVKCASVDRNRAAHATLHFVVAAARCRLCRGSVRRSRGLLFARLAFLVESVQCCR